MNVSLVITTFNWKEALELSIKSALSQNHLPEEIIVADDGSSDGTGDLVRRLAETASIPVIHLWQEDRGFRAAKSRNKAIAKAKGDYIVLIDGDILLEKHFMEDHIACAQKGFFVQGSRVILDERKTREVLAGGVKRFSVFSPGIGNRKNCIRSALLSRLFSYQTKKLGGIKTCNFAFWKADAVAVNGFNEEFAGWGREDSEFAVRLMNMGLSRKNLRFSAKAYHLFHDICSRDSLIQNDSLLQQAISGKLVWCDKGIRQYI